MAAASITKKSVPARSKPAASLTLQAEQLTERELREFLFQPGFSTADSKTELAGRGVGLDVVRANIHTLNGDIEIRIRRRRGTVFTLKVPLTLIISQALFVRSGTSVFAFPLAFVEEIRRLKPEEIEEVGGKLMTKVRGVDYGSRAPRRAARPAANRADQRLLPHGDRKDCRTVRRNHRRGRPRQR